MAFTPVHVITANVDQVSDKPHHARRQLKEVIENLNTTITFLRQQGFAFVGEIKALAGRPATLPLGWLECNGAILLRAEYPALFETIGVAFGEPSTDTFKLPDLRGRTLMGRGGTRLYTGAEPNNIVGSTGGLRQVTLIPQDMPGHTHDVTVADASDHDHNGSSLRSTVSSEHRHGIETTNVDDEGDMAHHWERFRRHSGPQYYSHNVWVSTEGDHTHTFTGRTAAAGGHTHSGQISSTGDGDAVDNIQPSLVIGMYIIFAGQNTPSSDGLFTLP